MRVDFAGKGLVVFEGEELPSSVKALHSALSFGERLSPGAQEWLMDLHYCWGRVRTLPASRVRRYSTEVLRQLESNEEASAKLLRENFPEVGLEDANNVVQEWKGSLTLINKVATSVASCSWRMSVTDEEVEKNLRLALVIAGKDPKNIRFALTNNAPAGLERRLRTMERKELLIFLTNLTDAMSTRVSTWERVSFRLKKLIDPTVLERRAVSRCQGG